MYVQISHRILVNSGFCSMQYFLLIEKCGVEFSSKSVFFAIVPSLYVLQYLLLSKGFTSSRYFTSSPTQRQRRPKSVLLDPLQIVQNMSYKFVFKDDIQNFKIVLQNCCRNPFFSTCEELLLVTINYLLKIVSQISQHNHFTQRHFFAAARKHYPILMYFMNILQPIIQ